MSTLLQFNLQQSSTFQMSCFFYHKRLPSFFLNLISIHIVIIQINYFKVLITLNITDKIILNIINVNK